jgi:diketogulonate reductase-like aldo/keto reductase
MDHSTLGDTGVRISKIGLGTFNYKGGLEPLRAGITLGATLIDTAESYETEEIVARAVHGWRDRVFLATKVSPANFKWRDLLAAAERSLQRLQTDWIDLYQLHRPNYVVPIEETMTALEELVKQGKIRFIGVSNFSVKELKQAQAALSKCKIVSNQVRYSLVERTIEAGLLPYCSKNHITVIAYSPLARGLSHLKKKDPNNTLGRVAAMTGRTEAQVALNWCLSKDVIAIPKASSAAHVVEDCAASGWSLSQEQTDLLEQKIGFRRRSRPENSLRQVARLVLQKIGYQPAFLP